MKVKIIEANMSYVFEDNLNKFLENDISVIDIKYRTSGSHNGISVAYNYSAMVLYNDVVTMGDLFAELDIESERQKMKREVDRI